MKKYLLPETGNFYKANLHCHSNLSDGDLTPEEIKAIYKDHGYSIVAYTDHDILLDHQDLTDNDFLALNGVELEIEEPATLGEAENRAPKRCHVCFVALEPDNLTQFCYHREKYLFGNAKNQRDKLIVDESKPDYERNYSIECVCDVMKTGREAGFFVTYNHPVWSFETHEQYAHYEGMHAMEICNWGSCMLGYDEYVPYVYDDILRTGKRIYCIATDDNHNKHPMGSVRYDSFGGFTMIKAEKLEYQTITKALLDGNFYASQGPQIHSLWYEDGFVHVKCSEAKKITLSVGRRRIPYVSEPDKLITEAAFEIRPKDVYFRITVTDENGKHANTNAYFIDELIK